MRRRRRKAIIARLRIGRRKGGGTWCRQEEERPDPGCL
jgi:hypothetical protein